MLTTRDYLYLAATFTPTGSDYAIAKLLDSNTATISRYRTGKRVMDNAMALRLATLLERDIGELSRPQKRKEPPTRPRAPSGPRFSPQRERAPPGLASVILAALILQPGVTRSPATTRNTDLDQWSVQVSTAQDAAPNGRIICIMLSYVGSIYSAISRAGE